MPARRGKINFSTSIRFEIDANLIGAGLNADCNSCSGNVISCAMQREIGETGWLGVWVNFARKLSYQISSKEGAFADWLRDSVVV